MCLRSNTIREKPIHRQRLLVLSFSCAPPWGLSNRRPPTCSLGTQTTQFSTSSLPRHCNRRGSGTKTSHLPLPPPPPPPSTYSLQTTAPKHPSTLTSIHAHTNTHSLTIASTVAGTPTNPPFSTTPAGRSLVSLPSFPAFVKARLLLGPLPHPLASAFLLY
jgi:hypothetical protein